MISIRSSADMARTLDGALDPPLRKLLMLRRDQLLDYDCDLGELVHIIIVQTDDKLATVEAEAGVPLAFAAFEFVERHGYWLEAVLILSDDGFGIALFVPDRIDIDPALLLPLRARLTHTIIDDPRRFRAPFFVSGANPMISAHDYDTFVEALARPVRADLQPLLTAHLHHALNAGLASTTHLLVVEATNSEAEIYNAVGFSPLNNPLDGSRFGARNYAPWFDGLRDCSGWYEMVICVGNSGFAFILLIEERDDELGRLCREHATR